MNKLMRYLAAMVITSLLFSAVVLKAQDATPEATASGTIACDSDVLLNLLTAENFFGFSQLMGTIQNPDPSTMVDLTTLNMGQYTSLFAALKNVPPSISMTPEQKQEIANMMQMDAATLQSQIANSIPAGSNAATQTTLNPASIAGEDPACTTLRAELNRFFTILNVQHLQNINPAAITPVASASPSGIGGSNSTGSNESGNGGAPGGNVPGNGAQNTPPPGGGSPGG